MRLATRGRDAQSIRPYQTRSPVHITHAATCTSAGSGSGGIFSTILVVGAVPRRLKNTRLVSLVFITMKNSIGAWVGPPSSRGSSSEIEPPDWMKRDSRARGARAAAGPIQRKPQVGQSYRTH